MEVKPHPGCLRVGSDKEDIAAMVSVVDDKRGQRMAILPAWCLCSYPSRSARLDCPSERWVLYCFGGHTRFSDGDRREGVLHDRTCDLIPKHVRVSWNVGIRNAL